MTGHPDQRWGSISYAQHGDDFFIINLFELIKVDKPSYLDIGAHHPKNISNTALLYERGSRGVNVEANPELIEAFRRDRPEDVNVNVGVGFESGIMPFYLFNANHGPHGAGRNTFDEDERDQMVHEGHPVQRIMNIDVHTINQVVESYCPKSRFPDLLTLDVEGFDYGILSSMDSTLGCPKVICVEVRKHCSDSFKVLLQSRGYFCIARLAENLIFVRNEFESLVR